MFGFAVIVATIYFFLEVYQVRNRKIVTLAFLLTMIVCSVLILPPFGAVLDADQHTIRLGTGYQIASGWYFASFTFVLALGYGFLGRNWKTDKKFFVIGLPAFATVGYGETLVNLILMLGHPPAIPAADSGFLFSSISYALYGIFLVYYFLMEQGNSRLDS